MSENLVVEASKFVLETPRSDLERCEKLRRIRTTLMPAEEEARSEADKAIAELERAARAERKGRRLGLSILSSEVFTWKKGRLPAFAVFDLYGDGECVISSDPAKEKIPASCKAFYADFFKEPLTKRLEKFFSDRFMLLWCLSALLVEAGYFYKMQAIVTKTFGSFILGLGLGVLASFCVGLMFLIVLIGGWTVFAREKEKTATARFAGTIPETARAKIRLYEPEFKEIIIVGEANWNFSAVKKAMRLPACCDPLIVGWDGDYFWLITCFDTSPLEQLVADEYSVKA